MHTTNALRLSLAACAALTMLNCGEPSTAALAGGDITGGDANNDAQTTRGTTLLPDTDYTRDLEIYDNVKPLDASVASTMQKTATELVLPDLSRQSEFAVGDVLVSDHGDGIFRVVEAVEARGSQLVLTTRPAKLEDAVASGQIYLAKLADDESTPPPAFQEMRTSQGMLLRQQALGFSKDFGWEGSLFSYNEDFVTQLNDRIPGDRITVTAANVNADLGAEVYAEVSAQLGWPPVSVPEARLLTNGSADGTLRIKIESDDQFNYNETIVLVGDSSRDPLVTMEPIEHTLLPGLFPLKFTFEASSELELRANIDGEIEAEVGYTLAAGATGGVLRKDGQWEPVFDSDVAAQRFGPVFRGEKNLELSAQLTNRVKLSLGEKASGYLEIMPATATGNFTQRIDANTGQCPTSFDLHARGTISGQLASIDIPLLGEQTIMGSVQNYTLYDRTFVDYDDQLELPGVCDPSYEPPTHAGTLLAGEKCGGSEECIAGTMCFQNTCVHEGKLRVSTAWQDNTDLDLYLELPSGEVIRWDERRIEGGYYDFHNCTRGCSTPGPFVESIYFEESAPEGTYRAWLEQSNGEAATSFEIEVDFDGAKLNFAGDIEQQDGSQSEIFEFTLDGGQLQGASSGGNGGNGGNGGGVPQG